MKREPTVTSVAVGLQKLIREVRHLQAEVSKLYDSLLSFTTDRPEFRSNIPVLPPVEGNESRNAKSSTDEPRSAIELARYEYGGNPNLEIPTRTLLAISRELDGALRDIRAIRLDVRQIAGNSDLRDEFREWQQNHQ